MSTDEYSFSGRSVGLSRRWSVPDRPQGKCTDDSRTSDLRFVRAVPVRRRHCSGRFIARSTLFSSPRTDQKSNTPIVHSNELYTRIIVNKLL